MKNSRRHFLKNTSKALSLAVLAGSSGALLNSCEKYRELAASSQNISKEVDLTSINDDIFDKPLLSNKIGRGATLYIKGVNYGIPVLICHLKYDTDLNITPPDGFAVFSSMCTHDHCSGKDKIRSPYGPGEAGQIVCGCHGSRYDAFDHAKVINGPAEKPLKEFPCSFEPETNILTINF